MHNAQCKMHKAAAIQRLRFAYREHANDFVPVVCARCWIRDRECT
jgi:hypothetical protein